MKPASGTSDEVLKMLINILQGGLEEISPVSADDDFNVGQYSVYVESLELVAKYWQDAQKYGVEQNIEKKYKIE